MNPEITVNDNPSFLAAYQAVSSPEQEFTGILFESPLLPPGTVTIVQRGPSTRGLRYRLDDVSIYTSSDDLSTFINKRVSVTGKRQQFELEGNLQDEIWPIRISLISTPS